MNKTLTAVDFLTLPLDDRATVRAWIVTLGIDPNRCTAFTVGDGEVEFTLGAETLTLVSDADLASRLVTVSNFGGPPDIDWFRS